MLEYNQENPLIPRGTKQNGHYLLSASPDVLDRKRSAGNIGASGSKCASPLYITDTPGTKESVGHKGSGNNVKASTCKERKNHPTEPERGKARQTSKYPLTHHRIA